MNLFELRDVRHEYAGKEVLRVDAWIAQQGEQWLMLGPSGSGKTTLLHILAGILKPTAGTVVVSGQDFATLQSSQRDRFRGMNVGIVLQQLHLMDSLSVMDNLLLAQMLAAIPQDRARVSEVLAGLDLADKAGARPYELSFGQAQRVAIARAIVNRPKLLLADEPTSNLDDARCLQAVELLQSQASACGATLVIATHDQRIKTRIGKHYLVEAQR